MKRMWKFMTKTRKRKVASLIAVLVLIGAAPALAYYLSYTGATGSGTASVGSGVASGDTQTQNAVTITATANAVTGGGTCAMGAFGPGCTQTYTLKASNLDPTAAETLDTISTPTITVDSAHQTAGCLASWFAWNWNNGDNTPDVLLAIGATNSPFGSTGSGLTFTNSTTTAQNACVGATLSLSFSGTTTP